MCTAEPAPRATVGSRPLLYVRKISLPYASPGAELAQLETVGRADGRLLSATGQSYPAMSPRSRGQAVRPTAGTRSSCAARLVPSTRARIFAKAISRLVEASSPN